MLVKYTQRVLSYCAAQGIQVPDGFHRHPASRFAVVLQGDPPRLVARTWFNKTDVVYYLSRIASGPVLEILDFKEGHRLLFDGSARLKPGEPLSLVE